jgi:hypothetical protein
MYPPVHIDPWQNSAAKERWRWTCDGCGLTELFTRPRSADSADIMHYCVLRHNELTQEAVKAAKWQDEEKEVCLRSTFKERGRYGRE